jgi:hypothetical protein
LILTGRSGLMTRAGAANGIPLFAREFLALLRAVVHRGDDWPKGRR